MAKKNSKLGRLAVLGGLTSRVSSSYFGQRLKGVFQSDEERTSSIRELHIENATRVADTMGQIKGAAMKVGQSLAILADSMDLPSEISQIFGRLHDQAQPIPFEDISRVIVQELGPINEVFMSIDPEPLGTASLAQAHAAQLLDGTPVVIKVLHEGVEFSVDTDLTALKSILIAGKFFRRPKDEIDMVFEEIRERLLEELDYENERQNIEAFSKMLANIDGVVVPSVISNLCTNRVLTMSRITGSNLDDFLKVATDEAKQKSGDVLIKVFHEMVYKNRLLHADPHGGNFLFQRDGSIGLIDFGCVKRFSVEFIGRYSSVANYLIDHNRKEMVKHAKEMNMLLDDNKEAEEALWTFGNIIARPFRVGEYTAGASGDSLMEEVRAFAPEILRHPTIRSPRDLIFLHRSLTGIYSMLRRLKYTCNYDLVRREYSNNAISLWREQTK